MDLQDLKLRSIIDHAYRYVPYYREIFDSNNIKPTDIQNTKDLVHIPVLTKDILRNRYHDLIANNSKYFKPYKNRTSGSTGTPLTFLQDRNVSIARFAFFWRIWQIAGYKPYMRWAQIDNMFEHKEDKIWQYNRTLNSLQISASILNDTNCKRVFMKLNRFNPKILRGYPNALYILALYAQKNKIDIMFKLKSIIVYSEKLYDYQRYLIKQIFNCEVFDVYSLWEAVCLISECEEHTKHQHMEFSAMELLDEYDQPVKESEIGEITATSFYNFAMPFIRYKTGDLASFSEELCPCGREHQVINEIEGRLDDLIITSEGAKVSRVSGCFEGFSGINYAQIVQSKVEFIDVYLVINNNYRETCLKILEDRLRKKLGTNINIIFRVVEDIKPSINGKRRLVVNNMEKPK